MIIGNIIGFLMFIAAAVVVLIGHFVLKLSDPITMAAAGFALIIIDFPYRYFLRKDERWLYGNNSGGNLFFLPAWGFGLVVFIANIARLFTAK